MLGTAGAEFFTSRASFVLTFLGATWWFAGAALGAFLTVPILFLLFSVPIPSVIYFNISLPLQGFASFAAANTLRLLGVPLVAEGNILHVPGGALEVADACSGIRSLTVLLALGALWAYTSRGGALRRAALLACTIPLAVLGNAVRVSFTAIGFLAFGPSITEGTLHETMGLVVFAVTLGGLAVASRLLRLERPS